MKISAEISKWLAPAIGIVCNEMAVGTNNSLNLGFGRGVLDPIRGSPDRMSYEWMMGTFNAAWRITDGKTVLTGSKESRDEKLVALSLRDIAIGGLVGIEMSSRFDIRVDFSTGLSVEFFSAATIDDEIFYIIGPNGFDAGYSYIDGWSLDSRPPRTNGEPR